MRERFSWLFKPLPNQAEFVLKWTFIVGGGTSLLGVAFLFMGIHGGGWPSDMALTLLPGLWMSRWGWFEIDHLIWFLMFHAAFNMFIALVIVLALNMVLRRQRDLG